MTPCLGGSQFNMKNPLNLDRSPLNLDPTGRNSMGSKFNLTPANTKNVHLFCPDKQSEGSYHDLSVFRWPFTIAYLWSRKMFNCLKYGKLHTFMFKSTHPMILVLIMISNSILNTLPEYRMLNEKFFSYLIVTWIFCCC